MDGWDKAMVSEWDDNSLVMCASATKKSRTPSFEKAMNGLGPFIILQRSVYKLKIPRSGQTGGITLFAAL